MSSRLSALMRKETLQIIRDPSSILISVFLPLLLLFLYGYGVSLDLDHLRVGVVMEDTSPDAQSFLESIKDSKYFDVHLERERPPLYAALEKGEIRGIIVIPSYFSLFRRLPDRVSPIQVIADGSEANTANFVQYYTQGVLANFLSQQVLTEGIEAPAQIISTPRFWYNEQLESRFFLLSGSLGIIMTLIGALLTALVVAREWERGTMEAILSTEVTVPELILGKVIPYFVLGMISMTLCVFISVFYYQLPFQGSWWMLFLVSASFLLSALSTGLLISTYSKIQMIASQITMVVAFLPAYILSGFLFEISSMPLPIRVLTYLMPARYFVQSLQTLFLTGNVWTLLFKNILIMLVFAAILFFITTQKTEKKL